MLVGIPREIKPLEGRVGLVPQACGELIHAGHQVFLEQGAGEASGFSDEVYSAVGVKILPDAEALYRRAELVIKVKEPVGPELDLSAARGSSVVLISASGCRTCPDEAAAKDWPYCSGL